MSKDGLSYTFHLYENARLHDGTPVTAEDVVFSMDSIVDPNADRPVVRSLLDSYYDPGNSRAIDEHTIQVTTKFPAADFLPTLALDPMKIIAKHWVGSGIDTDKWENAMGSGPFKPGKLIKDVSIELEKNRDYWKEGRPYLDGMKHFTIVDHGTIIASFKAEQVLIGNWAGTSNLSTAEVMTLGEEMKSKLTVYWVSGSSSGGLLINSTVKPFDDIRVRQAINLALYRQPIIKTFGGGRDTIGPAMGGGDTWFGRASEDIATLPGYRELNGEKHPDDLAKAKRLMAEAGFPDGFKTTILARTAVEFVDLAQIEAEQLKKYLNIDATIQTVDSATGLERYDKRDFALAAQTAGHTVIQPDAIIKVIWMPGGLFPNWTGWTAPDWFVDSFNKQSRELIREKRKALLREMEDYLINEDPGPLIILFWRSRHWIVNNRIKNFHMAPTLYAQMKHEHLWLEK